MQTILFDLGNVLVHFSHERMCEQLASLCERTPAEIRRDLFESQLHADYERGRLTEAILHEQLQTLYQRPLELARLQQAAGDIFELNESMLPVLDEFQRQGLRLVLLSNTNHTHYAWLRAKFDLLDRFDAQVLSFEVGAAKPEPAIFQAALQAIHCPPSECLYVDDIAEYVAVGRTFGLNAETFTTTEQFIRDLQKYGIEV